MSNIQVVVDAELIANMKFILSALFCIFTLNLGDVVFGRIYANKQNNDVSGFADVCMIATLCMCTFVITMNVVYNPNFTKHTIFAHIVFVSTVWFAGAVYQTYNGLLGVLFSVGNIQSKCLWGLYVASVVVMILMNTDSMSIIDYVVYGTGTFIYATLFSRPTQKETPTNENILHRQEIFAGCMSILLMIAPIATMDSRLLWIFVFGLLRPITRLVGSFVGLSMSYSDAQTKIHVKSSTFCGEYFWGQVQIFALVSGMVLLGYAKSVFQTIHQ